MPTIATTSATTSADHRTATLRRLRACGYPPTMRRKWWAATTYLRERGLWIVDGAPARWGASYFPNRPSN